MFDFIFTDEAGQPLLIANLIQKMCNFTRFWWRLRWA